uniref:Uncharacterized protein n=1 Tax=Tetradesmus obliquus TaxID=3088 RepID=A0A383VB34_TETOB|eukprot:jgi/Sobl393_1/16265/SZX62150.1
MQAARGAAGRSKAGGAGRSSSSSMSVAQRGAACQLLPLSSSRAAPLPPDQPGIVHVSWRQYSGALGSCADAGTQGARRDAGGSRRSRKKQGRRR